MIKVSEFRERAVELGAAVTEYGDFNRSGASWANTSAPYGGCGSAGCRCSPGLWVSMSDGAQVVIAHFGKDWSRDGDGQFNIEDFDCWQKLARGVGP